MFLINLLIADVGVAVLLLCANGMLAVLYLLNVNVNCRLWNRSNTDYDI